MSQAESAALRIGCVKYLNAQPLIHGWAGPVVFDHPAVLCRSLAAGELDVALVSSFEFLRQPIYSIVEDVAVAAHGAVYSVFVAHRGSVEDLTAIDIDPASLTSVNLLRCLLAERQLNATVMPESGCPVTATRGRLLIGDQAIRFRQEHQTRYEYWDLSEQWQKLTGLPFVFALWLIRPEISGAKELGDSLRGRRDANVAALENVVRAQQGFTPAFCEYYFRECLRFRLADAEKQGLLLFRSLCERHGILPPNATPLPLI